MSRVFVNERYTSFSRNDKNKATNFWGESTHWYLIQIRLPSKTNCPEWETDVNVDIERAGTSKLTITANGRYWLDDRYDMSM